MRGSSGDGLTGRDWFMLERIEIVMTTIKIKNDLDAREQEEVADSGSSPTVMPPADVVVFNEMRSCSDLYRMCQNEVLDMRPGFQRGIVWSAKDKSLFVDSLIKQLPIPSVCVSWDASTGRRLVIDGLQRISTIIEFLDCSNRDWTISKIEGVDSRLAGRRVTDIRSKEPRLYRILEECVLPINVIRCDYTKAEHMEYLFQIFSRLNSGGKRLLNQEIRNCVYQGSLNTFLKDFVRTHCWRNFASVTDKDIERLRFGNEERALRILAFYDNWEQYNASLVSFLNDYMRRYRNASDKQLSRNKILLERALTQFSRIEGRREVRKNWNLVESVVIGIAKNIDKCESMTNEELNDRYKRLISTNVYCEGMREGVMHTAKLKARIEQSISSFGV